MPFEIMPPIEALPWFALVFVPTVTYYAFKCLNDRIGRLVDRVQKLENTVAQNRVEAIEKFVSTDRMNERDQHINDKLDKMDKKLDDNFKLICQMLNGRMIGGGSK